MNLNKYTVAALLISALGLLIAACGTSTVKGSGKVISKTRPVSNFNKLSLNGIGELILTQGEQDSLRIEAEDNIIGEIETRVENNTLVIGFKEKDWQTSIKPTKQIVFHLSMKNVNGLELTGVGSINAGTLNTDKIEILSSGVGGINIGDLSAQSLKVALSGEGQCNLAGEVGDQQVEVNGTGQYSAAKLKSSTTAVELSGSGGATVWAEQNLTANISGTGSVYYYGNPQISKTITGIGGLHSLSSPGP